MFLQIDFTFCYFISGKRTILSLCQVIKLLSSIIVIGFITFSILLGPFLRGQRFLNRLTVSLLLFFEFSSTFCRRLFYMEREFELIPHYFSIFLEDFHKGEFS